MASQGPVIFTSALLIVLGLYRSVLAQGYSSCAVPNYRIMAVSLPGLFDVAPPGDVTRAPYSGFLVDLLDAMARVGKFTYTLRATSDGDFGHQQSDGCFNGAVGALVSSNIDIVVAALESTNPYQTVIDFTTPIFQSNVQILYNTRTGLQGTYYAVLANTATRDFLQNSRDPRLQTIWANILAYLPDSLPQTYDEAINLVMKGGWALIGRTPAIDNAVYSSNGLLAKDPSILRKVFAGFAVQLGSPIRQKLNVALNQLQDDGTVDLLLAKYFPYSSFACQ